jgi:hypothetical protein
MSEVIRLLLQQNQSCRYLTKTVEGEYVLGWLLVQVQGPTSFLFVAFASTIVRRSHRFTIFRWAPECAALVPPYASRTRANQNLNRQPLRNEARRAVCLVERAHAVSGARTLKEYMAPKLGRCC